MILHRLLASRYSQVNVIGAFRCGTNYLRILIENNFYCTVHYHSFGWKHGGVPIFAETARVKYPSLPVIYVSKNPYSFLVSMYKYYKEVGRNIDAEETWGAFIRNPIVIYDTDRKRSPQMRFCDPIEYWNWFYWNATTLPCLRFNAIGLRYEDLLKDAENALEPIEHKFELVRVSRNFIQTSQRAHRMADRPATRKNMYTNSDRFDSMYYEYNKYMEMFSQSDLHYVAGRVDNRLAAGMQYEVIGGKHR